MVAIGTSIVCVRCGKESPLTSSTCPSCGAAFQKVGEAEVMAESGISDIFISNEVVGRQKMIRLTRLAEKVRLMVAADDLENVMELGRSCREADVEVGVYVDVDCGMHRTGVAPEKAWEIAEKMTEHEGLYLVGVMGYEGHAGAPTNRDESRLVDGAVKATLRAVQIMKA